MTQNSLRSLFTLKPSEPQVSPAPEMESSEQAKITYKRLGFTYAGNNNGENNALKTSLNTIKARIIQEQARDQNKQNTHKEQIQGQIAQIDIDYLDTERKIKEKEDAINRLESDIKSKEDEVDDIRRNPSKVTDLHRSIPALRWIGVAVLTLLSLYLFVFYSSASYSAFFKEFEIGNDAIHQAIFDAQAISKSYQMGITSIFLILLVPVIFFGLGLLIHIFLGKGGRSSKINTAGLILITFIFDAILAFEILEKIHELQRQNSFIEMPEYSLSLAVVDVKFWLIIFAGFIVYIIWGFLFDHVMEMFTPELKIKEAIHAIQQEITALKDKVEAQRASITELNAVLANLKKSKADLETQLRTTWWSLNDVRVLMSEFFQGWCQYLNQVPLDTHEAHRIYDEYMTTI